MALVALVTLDLGTTTKRDDFYKALENMTGWSKLPAKLIKDSWRVGFNDSWIISSAHVAIKKDLLAASAESKLGHFEAAVQIGPEVIVILNV